MNNNLFKKILNNQETVVVIGLGYVGLSLALSFEESNLDVIGFDTSKNKVDKIHSGFNHVNDVRDKTLKEVVKLNKTNT